MIRGVVEGCLGSRTVCRGTVGLSYRGEAEFAQLPVEVKAGGCHHAALAIGYDGKDGILKLYQGKT